MAGVLLVVCTASLHAQFVRSRSSQYLFASTAADVRATWINPAGLAIRREASIMLEAVLERPGVGSNLRVAQWTAGLNSRGFSISYQRDLLPTDSSNNAFRFGIARGFQRGSVGLSFTIHTSDSTGYGFGAGVRYILAPGIEGALVGLNIGQPTVRGVKTPFLAVGSLAWGVLNQAVQVAGEAAAQNRLGDSGYDVTFRGGLVLSSGGTFPIRGIGTMELNSDFGFSLITFGLSVGGPIRGIGLGSVRRASESTSFNALSLTALATRPLRRR